MKAKYFVITILSVILVWIIYKMMQYESSIRETRVVTVKVKDETQPLITVLPKELLKDLALSSDYFSVATGDYFQIATRKNDNGKKAVNWKKIFLKGVNLGVAMPGKFPTEFSLAFKDYLEWFRMIEEMGSNVIRIYTILPPNFYEALKYYNLHHSNNPLYLLPGVWMEEPLEDNYYNPRSQRDFQQEIIDVLDVIHGNAVLEPSPGKANGTYVADISQYVIGIILGREWEPKAVTNTNKLNKEDHFSGNFISVYHATAMEAWLAQMMDFTVLYETQTYHAQRPVSFVNWLTLDPMYHSTEFIENKKVKEYDNDLESIDLRKFQATELFFPGIFASYHVYPYYPDFIYLQENYANTVNRYGKKDNFLGYLHDLKQHHPGMPLIIAEYGLPSSRGNSHYNPYGFHQGGLSEKEQAERSAILTNDIYDAQCGGAIFFEWIDEWFKFNWLVMDFEQPSERRKFWNNMENPEKNFGVMAVEARSKTIDGNLSDWKDFNPPADKAMYIRYDADASYFYIAAHLPEFNFQNNKLYIALDTYDKDKGEHKLPFLEEELANGVEFLLQFSSEDDAKILVDDKYSIYTDVYSGIIPVYGSKENNNGIFSEQLLLPNRSRETLLGDTIPAIYHNRGNLIHGNSSLPEFSNADWYWNNQTKMLEVRLTWHLINVSDPSQRYVLDDQAGTKDIDCIQTPGFNIFSYKTGPDNTVQEQQQQSYTWETWEIPSYKTRLKPIYYELQKCFSKITVPSGTEDILPMEDKFEITPFYENKPGAISIAFGGGDYFHYLQALHSLEKYNMKASFGVSKDDPYADSSGQAGLPETTMDATEIINLSNAGHEIALRFPSGNTNITGHNNGSPEYLKALRSSLEETVSKKIFTLYDASMHAQNLPRNAGFTFSWKRDNSLNVPGHITYTGLSSMAMENTTNSSRKELDSLFKSSAGKWTILTYQDFFAENSKEFQQFKASSKKKFTPLSPELFEAHTRLIRNSGYWIAPVASVGQYLKEKEASRLKIATYNNLIFLTVTNKLDEHIYNHPLTIRYTTQARKIRISNSSADGVYNAREGKVYFNVYPNKVVTIEILEK